MQENLRAHGGESKLDAPAFIGRGAAPNELPSVSLGEHVGTLGPNSFGFLNNVGGIAALDVPVRTLPKRGSVGVIVPERAALPDVLPLLVARDVRCSWVISVGAGDPSDALAYLGADPNTSFIAVALSSHADGHRLKGVLGDKPLAVLGGDALCQAVARRTGAFVSDQLSLWLARVQLLQAGITAGAPVRIIVAGGGAEYVRGEMKTARLSAEVVSVAEASALPEELGKAHAAGEAVVLLAGTDELDDVAHEHGALLTCDLRQPEQFAAILAQLAERPAEKIAASTRVRIDRELLERVRSEIETTLSDHDAKRMLKAYGVRVTRQAPASTPTAAVKHAQTIGLPVAIVAGEKVRHAETVPDVRRVTTLALEESDAEVPSVIVREIFPAAPHAAVTIEYERAIGLTMRVGTAAALLPLSHTDAELLAEAAGARRQAEIKNVAEFLSKIAACAVSENLVLDLGLYIGAEPAVLSASGAVRSAAT